MPLPLSTKVTPLGRAAPPRAIDGFGDPLVVTVNVPALPTVNVVAFALVTVGMLSTLMANVCTAEVSTPPFAVPPLSWIWTETVAVPL